MTYISRRRRRWARHSFQTVATAMNWPRRRRFRRHVSTTTSTTMITTSTKVALMRSAFHEPRTLTILSTVSWVAIFAFVLVVVR